MLGYGIYFSDSLKTSLKYAKPSRQRDSCLVGICEVALGKCCEYSDYDTKLTKPPADYDSTHGNNTLPGTKFVDSEYVIYDVSQYKLRFIVELETAAAESSNDDEKEIRTSKVKYENYLTTYSVKKEEKDMEIEQDSIEVDEVIKTGSTNDQKSSLKSTSGKPMPLKSVHVRAKIIDMSAKVSIYQEYENDEDRPIEAEYLFPLNDGATVCGFEAFINDKHVIGVCKEREQAHREYKEAIAQGKGAYLMDQETNEVFKVNVGNLPPKCKCVIKITYLTELDVQNDR